MDPKQKQEEQDDIFSGFQKPFKSFATDAIHVGQEPDQWKSMAVVPPISLSTTFKQFGPGQHAVRNHGLLDYRNAGGGRKWI